MQEVYLLLGSNEGDSPAQLRFALQQLEEETGKIQQVSSLYQTEAWGLEQQPDFLNQVVVLQTLLSPEAFLAAIQKIEALADRQRIVKWGQRTLDIDILFWGEEHIDTESLKVPHPQIADRRFTLVPLCEIAKDKIHPILKKTMQALLDACTDSREVKCLAAAG